MSAIWGDRTHGALLFREPVPNLQLHTVDNRVLVLLGLPRADLPSEAQAPDDARALLFAQRPSRWDE